MQLSGKTPEEIEQIQTLHRNKSKQTLANMVERYGEKEGTLRYNQYREKNKLRSNRRMEYWISKCGGDLELAKRRYREWQQRDLKYFTSKYGEVDGIQRYYNQNRKRGRTLENYVNKYGPLEGLKRFCDACRKWKDGQRGVFNSSGQLEVENYLRTLFPNTKGSRNETGMLLDDSEKTEQLTSNTMYPDIIVNDRYVINYNGDFWHANKIIFPDDTTIVGRINKPAGLIRQIDCQKKAILEARGYTVIDIWDSEWQTNKETIKEKLKNIIL